MSAPQQDQSRSEDRTLAAPRSAPPYTERESLDGTMDPV